ncbi:MAG TPA: arginase family protein [Candidatus Egerieimonas intestinavium]|uniref:Arginase family protein n=1 Tax=Candidatus Egerieimonas intestinavium TaxID=2840777 RepID=A0A9D1JG77_9FIRM|nr:arginase family protein [Candidatus Egerieimonas intestinavium]
MSTLRLMIPEWRGGLNPNYVFGSELLAHIAPPNETDETICVEVNRDFQRTPKQEKGIDEGAGLLSQMSETEKLLREKNPDKLIVFGGDCSVTQIPFDYLNGKYKGELGVIWLDAHPDISGVNDSSHLHEMVLGNLLGLNQTPELTRAKHPLKKSHVIMAGLIEEELREMDRACRELKLKIASPDSLKKDSGKVMEWIKENKIRHVAVHWDLDVLSPADFRSIYPAEPYTEVSEFPAAVGRMTLEEVGRLLRDVSGAAEIVGLSLTEHLPWDAIRLRKTLSDIDIFR